MLFPLLFFSLQLCHLPIFLYCAMLTLHYTIPYPFFATVFYGFVQIFSFFPAKLFFFVLPFFAVAAGYDAASTKMAGTAYDAETGASGMFPVQAP